MKILVINAKGGVGKSTLVASLADVLEADIVDTDHQATLTKAAKLGNRHIPVPMGKVTKPHVIIDTPPYNEEGNVELMRVSDVVLIPTKASLPDLIATGAVMDIVERFGFQKKCLLVFNEVRRPYNNTYKECLRLFEKNYKIRRARTELSNLVAYRRVLAEPLKGKAREEIENLVAEINSIFRLYK